jgi:hypothetical protein
MIKGIVNGQLVDSGDAKAPCQQSPRAQLFRDIEAMPLK